MQRMVSLSLCSFWAEDAFSNQEEGYPSQVDQLQKGLQMEVMGPASMVPNPAWRGMVFYPSHLTPS